MKSPVESILNLLDKDWQAYREVFFSVLSTENRLLNQINAYLGQNGGKQIRPMLSLLTARAILAGSDHPIDFNRALGCAAVAELIHTATLLHDDVADDSDVRRGKPTVKAKFSAAASVLVGDFWLSRGLKILIDNRCDYAVLQSFALALDQLSSGEMLQMECADDLRTTESDYYQIISCKTSSLFVATLRSTAIEMGASPEVCESICEFAEQLGLSFQIRDDIFDYSPQLETGKAGGSDILERKITLPLLGAFHKADETPEGQQEKAALLAAIEQIDPTENKPEYEAIQQQTQAFVLRYDGIAYADQALNVCIQKAKKALDVLVDSPYKTALLNLTDYMCVRTR
ncbi:MAG: polyprenyl synthetase family protein [Bacteroidales bacterium]|nr:polyprenyl synthetase family protein [Bacteroidales bacterium]